MKEQNKDIDLLTALTVSKCVIESTITNLMQSYNIPNYIMAYVLTDVLSEIRKNTIEDMIASSVSKKETGVGHENIENN